MHATCTNERHMTGSRSRRPECWSLSKQSMPSTLPMLMLERIRCATRPRVMTVSFLIGSVSCISYTAGRRLSDTSHKKPFSHLSRRKYHTAWTCASPINSAVSAQLVGHALEDCRVAALPRKVLCIVEKSRRRVLCAASKSLLHKVL